MCVRRVYHWYVTGRLETWPASANGKAMQGWTVKSRGRGGGERSQYLINSTKSLLMNRLGFFQWDNNIGEYIGSCCFLYCMPHEKCTNRLMNKSEDWQTIQNWNNCWLELILIHIFHLYSRLLAVFCIVCHLLNGCWNSGKPKQVRWVIFCYCWVLEKFF